MIKMQNVRKVYPGFDFELSMEIPEGRITGLIGKNGAGKSTAIRLMLGLAKADGGIIELFGKPITEIMAEDRQNIGVSLAESGFNGQFTIVEVEKILAKMYPKFEESWFTRECQKLHLPEGKQFKEFSQWNEGEAACTYRPVTQGTASDPRRADRRTRCGSEK